jgi:hypothetical protein
MLRDIERAISNSHKTELKLKDGRVWTFHPYFILRRYDGKTVLHGFVEGDTTSCDVALDEVDETIELPEHYAVNDACLNFRFADYEVVYPKKGDLPI